MEYLNVGKSNNQKIKNQSSLDDKFKFVLELLSLH